MQLQRGKYQTRTNRIVEITGSQTELRQKPGIAQPVPTRMWAGVLFQMDGKTPESQYTWTDAGGFFGTAQGVASPHDLVNLVSSAEPEAQPVEEVNADAARADAAEKHAELMGESLATAHMEVENLRGVLGLIRVRAVEELRFPGVHDREAYLNSTVDLVNAAIGEKHEVAA